MARPLRIEFAGALYHVTSRGDRQETIFKDDEDREVFLRTLAEVVERSTGSVTPIDPLRGQRTIMRDPAQTQMNGSTMTPRFLLSSFAQSSGFLIVRSYSDIPLSWMGRFLKKSMVPGRL